jgi:hypothetical protein
MSVDHNVYNKIICQEVHLFQPFSSKDSGAQTIIKQVLTLLTESNSTSEVPGNLLTGTSWIYSLVTNHSFVLLPFHTLS